LQLIELLVNAEGALHPEQLASALRLHPSTVTGHLAVLVDARFVKRVTEGRDLPGRPRVLYRATTKTRARTIGCSGYRTLAEVLTAYLDRAAPEPQAAGERAGLAWGAQLTRGAPTSASSPTAALGRLCDLLDQAGFPAELEHAADGPVLVHRQCPLAGLVEEHASVVCGLHLGLLRGLLEGIDAPLEVDQLSGTDRSRCDVRFRPRRRTWQL
jgi:predicted ArsR family transcriptional regulator